MKKRRRKNKEKASPVPISHILSILQQWMLE